MRPFECQIAEKDLKEDRTAIAPEKAESAIFYHHTMITSLHLLLFHQSSTN